jgi:hypothetical protein
MEVSLMDTDTLRFLVAAVLFCLVMVVFSAVELVRPKVEKLIEDRHRRRSLEDPPIVWDTTFVGPERWDFQQAKVRNWERLAVDI